MSKQMNIVVVVSDTFRTAFLGAYGNDWIHTPNLDRFASESVRFTHAHPRVPANNSHPANVPYRPSGISL